MNKIAIYRSDTNQIEITVQMEKDTVWLNRNQLAELFNRDIKTIGKHIGNVFKEGELDENSVVAKFASTATDGKTYSVKHYNLDVIISVGYRVKSKQGTQFRIWANQILKDYLRKSYAINKKRLEQKEQEVKMLKDGIHILTRAASIAIEEQSADTKILQTFAQGLNLLDDYDHEELDTQGLTRKDTNYPSLTKYHSIINVMLDEFDSDVFGKEKDKSFDIAVKQIEKALTKQIFTRLLKKRLQLYYT